MKKLLLLLLITNIAFSQDKVDSLISSIQNKSTVEQIKILDDFCWKNRDANPKLALKAVNIALMLAESINDKHYISKSLNFISVIYRDQGEYEKSLKYANRGLDVASLANDKVELAYSYNNISTIYRLMGNYPDAIEKLYKALNIFESINDSTGLAYCYYNLGLVYLKQGNLDKASENFNKTFQIRERIGDVEGKSKALGRLAETYLKMNQDKKALEIFNQVEKIYDSLSDQRSLIVIRTGIAEIFKKKKDYKRAIEEREKALNLSRKIEDVIGIVDNLSELGNLYAILRDYSKAKKYLDEAKALSDKYNSIELKINTYKNLTEYYESQSNFIDAYKTLKMLNTFKDSINLREKKTAVSEVESAYQIAKREKENLFLKAEYEKQELRTKYIILVIVLLLILTFTLFVLYRNHKKTSQKLTELNATKDKFFSIIAHDLKNPITSQFGLTSILIEEFNNMSNEEKLEIIKAIDNAGKQTYKLLENLLYWARTQTGGLEVNPQKLNLNNLILEVISLLKEQAYSKKIKIEYEEKPESFIYADEEMVKTVLRNLISNAIKFTYAGGTIKINIDEKNKFKIVSVKDNGIGIEKNLIENIFRIDKVSTTKGTDGEKGTGLGLILCKEFIEKNNGKIWVESEIDKGTTFYFALPSH